MGRFRRIIDAYEKKLMSVNHEVKGSLARLLATENLVVEHKKVSTASFDVLNRVLVLPLWDKASPTVYDMLVGHEVGHALYTPDQWDFIGEIPKDYVNVIEDARIEKLMKRKYPGLAKSFYKGYNELNDDDFFSIEDDDLETFSLIDRINLHFKIGAYARVPFSDQEEKFVDLTESAETFDDVLNVCRKIMGYIKDKEIITQTPQEGSGTPQAGSGTSQEESGEGDVGDDESYSSQQSEKTTSNIDSDSDDDGIGSEEIDENISKTQRSFDNELKDLNQNNNFYETTYIEIPNIHIDRVIIDHKDLHDHIDKFWNSYLSNRDPKYWENPFKNSDSEYKKYKSSAQKEVNYLVKEFECKKSADSYSRSAVSRTGVLDTSKLHTYKYNEDVFRKVSVVPDGKNHGLIFLLDWSGSMSDYILDTVKQLFNLVWFCKKVQIPFEVYAFTYEFSDRLLGEEVLEKYDRKSKVISINEHFHLLNFFSSRSNSREIENHLQNIWRIAYRNDRSCHDNYGIPSGLELSGTPLNESIISLHKIIPQFKEQNKLQKVNIILLTDGEANSMAFDTEIKLDKHSSYMGYKRCSNLTALRDRKTGNVYRNFDWNTIQNSMTTILLENIKHNFPEINLIGFRILSGYEFNSFCRRNFLVEDNKLSKSIEKWRKEKSTEFNDFGYDALYAISSNSLSSNIEFEIDEESSNAQIGKAFRKMLKNKSTNKKILSSFASLVA